MSKTVKVGMVGTGFVGDLHHAAFKGWVRNAEVIAVSSPNHAAKFAEERGIASHYRSAGTCPASPAGRQDRGA